MSTPVAIRVEGLGKAFRKRGLAPPTLFGTLSSLVRRHRTELFWALRDISFEVPRGATIGVVGPNGSGKSSLLGLIAGTLHPTEGRVMSEGRIASLLELGAGFHPDLTGRENVFLNAALLGIPREDVAARFDHIVGFADMQEFIDVPVKHYSSGMYVRLGFAVATELRPDILLVDEVLSVGDIAFQLKCLDRIRQFQREGRTILFVSHALQTVEEFCHEAILIHRSRLTARGDPAEVILSYIRAYMGEGGYLYTQEFGTRDVEFGEVRLLDARGDEAGTLTSGERMTVEIPWVAKVRIPRPVFGYSLKTGNGLYLFGSNTQIEGVEVPDLEGEGTIRLHLDPLTLMRGNFFLSLSIHSWDHAIQYHRREDWYPFSVRNPTEHPGLVRLPHRWEVGGQ